MLLEKQEMVYLRGHLRSADVWKPARNTENMSSETFVADMSDLLRTSIKVILASDGGLFL